jgi:hypothetical protein
MPQRPPSPTPPTEAALSAEVRPKAQLRRSDRDIARNARRQHGVLTLAQLAELGLSARAVTHRLAAGRLHRVYRGVYAVGEPSRQGRWMGALLASGGNAVLSHRSAAALWGIHDDGVTVHVTRMGRAFRAPCGIEAHSGSAFESSDRAVRDAIPCTSLPRTLIDLATQVDRRALTRAIDRAEELRVFDLGSLRATLASKRGRRGVRAVADVLATYAGPAMTRNEVEACFLAIVSRAGLPTPEVNVWVPLPEGDGYRPDFLWRDIGLVVEVDGRTHHARMSAFEHDRRRDRRLALAGYTTHRFAASEIAAQPRRVARELRAFIALAS